MTNTQKVLVTGSTGFILSNFVRKITYETNRNKEKYPFDLVSIDKISGNPNVIYHNRNHTFHVADIRDEHIIDKIFQFEKPDIIVHGAACSHVDYSITDPNPFITNNILGTQVLINASVKYGVKKFILLSSDEVMGQLTNENDTSWTEEAPLNPRSVYSASKAAQELLVKAANATHGLIYNITRSSNNYGPRQTPEKLIPKAIKCILNDQKIPVYGQGLQIRDWTHVFDNCAAILKIMVDGAPNETYNISANQEFTNIEVIHEICKVMGKGHELISFVSDRLGHDFRYSVDCTKLKKLGWQPEIKFKSEEGIEACCKWYQLNQWFLK